jgi:hypothetical protein
MLFSLNPVAEQLIHTEDAWLGPSHDCCGQISRKSVLWSMPHGVFLIVTILCIASIVPKGGLGIF